ncbi:MAG: Fe-S cluster assembly protein SufD [Gammaproteobacteria bacterium]|nr:MAG: Fe-S cluster assembly protein SufD [Gammaproteobacteria bacterium]
MNNTAIHHYCDSYKSLKGSLPGKALNWLAQSRDDAIEQFSDSGLPGTQQEDWKYTSVRSIEKRLFKPADSFCVGLDLDDIEDYLIAGLDTHLLTFLNGRFTPQLSKPGKLADGIIINNLAKAFTEHAELLETHLNRYANTEANGFTSLNTAFINDGALIFLPNNTVIEKPVQLLFLSTSQDQETVAHNRVLVVAGQNSQATLIESYASMGNNHYLNNMLTEISLAPNAVLTHYKLQHESTKAFHISMLEVRQAKDSQFTSHSVSLGAQLARHDINIHLDGEGADCTLNGLYVTDGKQHVDYHTNVEHAKPNGASREYYKGILDGRSRAVFNGRVHVHQDAQKTDAEQSNKNLLLSRDAEIDTKPQLEIFADDVKCSHGAAIGQLDENMLFYLRARGISEDAARALLTWGFAHDIIERMSLEPVQKWLEKIMVNTLPGTGQLEDIA